MNGICTLSFGSIKAFAWLVPYASLPIGFLWAKMCECFRVVDLPPLSFRTPKVPGVPQCKSDIPKYCNMLTKYVVRVVGQKCEPFFLVVDGSSLNASLG